MVPPNRTPWHLWHVCSCYQLLPQSAIRPSAPAGWQNLCEGTKGLRRKVWTRTKISSTNIRYFVVILRFVAIFAVFGRLGAIKCFWGFILSEKECGIMITGCWGLETNNKLTSDQSQLRRLSLTFQTWGSCQHSQTIYNLKHFAGRCCCLYFSRQVFRIFPTLSYTLITGKTLPHLFLEIT